MPLRRLLLCSAMLGATLFGAACSPAERFFSGRPSGMSMVHGHAIGGDAESMAAILRVPARFPDAKPEHRTNWQGSIVAWQLNDEGRARIVAALPLLNEAERAVLATWIAHDDSNSTAKERATLDAVCAQVTGCRRGAR